MNPVVLKSVEIAVSTPASAAADRVDPAPVDRQAVPPPRSAAAADVAMHDWDTLFDAIIARLTAMVDEGMVPDAQAGVRECVGALMQLQATGLYERARNLQLDRDLVEARSALIRARVDLVSSRSAERRSRHLALHDVLTTLPNRSFFAEWLEHSLQQATPLQEQFAVLYLDLDGFKTINDLHGHDVGDELLCIVASRLARAVRAEDIVSRVGGDEFACLLTRMPGREQAVHLACKLFDAISAPVKVGSLELTVRPSIGIAMCPDDGVTAEALLRNADTAMYHAKRHGSGYAFFDAGSRA